MSEQDFDTEIVSDTSEEMMQELLDEAAAGDVEVSEIRETEQRSMLISAVTPQPISQKAPKPVTLVTTAGRISPGRRWVRKKSSASIWAPLRESSAVPPGEKAST